MGKKYIIEWGPGEVRTHHMREAASFHSMRYTTQDMRECGVRLYVDSELKFERKIPGGGTSVVVLRDIEAKRHSRIDVFTEANGVTLRLEGEKEHDDSDE